MGGSTSGSREEMAERLLGLRGLKDREVLSQLSTEDLKRIQKRFGIPDSSGTGGLLGAFFGDEHKDLVDRISKAAAKDRAPRPRLADKAATPPSAPTAQMNVPPAAPAPEAPIRPYQPTPAPPVHVPQVATPSQPVGLPAFQEVRDFVGAYKFAYQWDREDLYEAEMLGSLRGRFGINNAIRQQGESGRVYDIVVRNSARIEIKLPKAKAELDRMIGQVRRYMSQHPGGVIVVIVPSEMKNRQEIHDAQEELEGAGAVVFIKS